MNDLPMSAPAILRAAVSKGILPDTVEVLRTGEGRWEGGSLHYSVWADKSHDGKLHVISNVATW